MITEILQIAATDTNSIAYKVGQVFGAVIGLALLIGLPILFILSLVKLISTKNKAWIIGIVLSGIPLILIAGGMMYGFYQGYKSAKVGTSSARTNIVMVPDTKLSLNIPSHWSNLNDLNDAASLGMGNLFREEYLVVIAESKADFDGNLTDYSDLTVTSMIDSIDHATAGSPVSLTLNGLPAIQREFSGTVDRTKIAYVHTSVEGGEHYYQVICWTTPSRKTSAFKTFHGLINSAKE